MNQDVTLRLLEPMLLMGGVALALMAVCAFATATRLRVGHLYVASAALLFSALPWLVRGGTDTLVWFGIIDVTTYPPDFVMQIAGLRNYLLLFAACSIATAAYRLLRQQV